MSARVFLLLTAAVGCLVHAASLPPHDPHDHSHDIQKSLPDTWYHAPDHPAHALFRRDPPGDGMQYPPVGSPTWRAAYPAASPDVSALPQPWVDALNAAVSAGNIPNIPQTTGPPGQNPIYPNGTDPNNPAICSGTLKCRNPDDLWEAPTGFIGTGFDDGPQPVSMQLAQFLQANNASATHFVIGVNVLYYPDQFLYIFNTAGHDIAVHTWTHPYMTKLSNLEVLAQLGWSMQLIHDSTGGRLPRFWRPPYGDADNRVRAIAKEVFGLRTIFWNQDTADWSLNLPNGTTLPAVAGAFQNWLTGPKSPGLIILEHELTNDSVQAFINAYPVMKSNGWRLLSVAQIAGNGTVYQNSQNSFTPVTAVSGVLAYSNSTSTSATSTVAAATATTMAASVTPSTSTVPSTSAAQIRWGITTWSTHLSCVAIALVASVLLADPNCR